MRTLAAGVPMSGKFSRMYAVSGNREGASHEHSVTAITPPGLRNRRHSVSPLSKPML